MKDKLVSIIIPCYNAEKFINQSIESIYIQDYSNIELIVVNDGSTDNSERIILTWKEKFEDKGFNLKYISQENQGQGMAVNSALKVVSGKYLTLLDADDRYLQGSISIRARYLDENQDCAGVRSNGWYIRKDGKSLFITEQEEKEIIDMFTALSFGKTNNWAGTYMVRTDILFEMYPDKNILPSRLGQNFQILLPVSYNRKFGYIDKPLMEYYIQDNSHSHSSDAQKQYELWKKNATGWREIYIDVLNKIVTIPNEYNYYLNGYNSVYYRGLLIRAIKYDKKEDIEHYYNLLKSTGLMTIDDRINYYNKNKSLVVIPLKIARKIIYLFKGRK